MDQILIMPRGHGKYISSYFRWLLMAYLKGDISREDCLTMIAVARVELLHHDYDETLSWLEKMLESDSDRLIHFFDWLWWSNGDM